MHTPIEVRSCEQAAADQMFMVRDWLISDLARYNFTGQRREKAKAFLADIEAAILEGKTIDTYARTLSVYHP